uniref:GNAT family N-acetyltransferase n=1 Tax=Acetatifactor sp. TaxID=1872090 RepID=UPI0040564240
MNVKIIETERLILRPLTIDDAPDVFEWAGDPIVNRYMPYPLLENVHQTPSGSDGPLFCGLHTDSPAISEQNILHRYYDTSVEDVL